MSPNDWWLHDSFSDDEILDQSKDMSQAGLNHPTQAKCWSDLGGIIEGKVLSGGLQWWRIGPGKVDGGVSSAPQRPRSFFGLT